MVVPSIAARCCCWRGGHLVWAVVLEAGLGHQVVWVGLEVVVGGLEVVLEVVSAEVEYQVVLSPFLVADPGAPPSGAVRGPREWQPSLPPRACRRTLISMLH